MGKETRLKRSRITQCVELVTLYLEQAVDRFPNVYALNLNDLVCPDAYCNAVSKDGQVVFRDSQHLTDSFVRAQPGGQRFSAYHKTCNQFNPKPSNPSPGWVVFYWYPLGVF